MKYATDVSPDLLQALLRIRNDKSISVGVNAFSLVIEIPFVITTEDLSGYKPLCKALVKKFQRMAQTPIFNLRGGAFNITMSQESVQERPFIQYNFLCFGKAQEDANLIEQVSNCVSKYANEFKLTLTILGENGQLTNMEETNKMKIWRPVSTILSPSISKAQFKSWKDYLKLHHVRLFGVLKDSVSIK